MNICNYCEHENTCKNKPLATTRCKDYKEKSEELKPCPIEDEKDREIAELKKELNEVLKIQSENYGSGMTTHLKLLLWASKYRTRNKTWKIETGKGNDVPANDTDNNVGSMESEGENE
jgi:predicted RNase H-like nuclease (RuvC/YqgF family)